MTEEFIAVGSIRDRDLSDPHQRGVWESRYLPTPAKARDVLRQWSSEGRDVYRSIYRRTEPTHSEGSDLCLPSDRIGFEVDQVAGMGRAKDVLRQVDPTLVSSGSPGHYHVYVQIDQVLPWSELRDLAKGLYRAVGVVEGGKYGGGFLRVPGSSNYKYDPPRPVRYIRHGDVLPLGTLRSVVRAHTTPVGVVTTSTLQAEPYGDLSAGIRRMLREDDAGGARRHRLTFKLIRMCQEYGLTKGQTLGVLLDHPATGEKFDEREMTREVHSCWKPETPEAKWCSPTGVTERNI
ncbi:hypothetical protein L5I01_21945 [Gordonia sp. HY442]|uniref:hypothetical protein n=1 Tax=Gordonia zhenghanii TaxID=2911516 RepID=UPI001F18CC7C|nr:hypothetical protein [Gordonia zhenghanii]MCF8606018.1 hypothetical protein [Gordonia zhenghanii]